MTWTLERIRELVHNKIEENLHLDYKRLLSLNDTKEISKDISAFANSDGGTVIYGVIEKNNKPEQIDNSSELLNKSKEWLENIITSNINPIIDAIVITPINKPDSGNQLFVIDILKVRERHTWRTTIDITNVSTLNLNQCNIMKLRISETGQQSLM